MPKKRRRKVARDGQKDVTLLIPYGDHDCVDPENSPFVVVPRTRIGDEERSYDGVFDGTQFMFDDGGVGANLLRAQQELSERIKALAGVVMNDMETPWHSSGIAAELRGVVAAARSVGEIEGREYGTHEVRLELDAMNRSFWWGASFGRMQAATEQS